MIASLEGVAPSLERADAHPLPQLDTVLDALATTEPDFSALPLERVVRGLKHWGTSPESNAHQAYEWLLYRHVAGVVRTALVENDLIDFSHDERSGRKPYAPYDILDGHLSGQATVQTKTGEHVATYPFLRVLDGRPTIMKVLKPNQPVKYFLNPKRIETRSEPLRPIFWKEPAFVAIRYQQTHDAPAHDEEDQRAVRRPNAYAINLPFTRNHFVHGVNRLFRRNWWPKLLSRHTFKLLPENL